MECLYISSVAQSCPTLCDPLGRSTHGFPSITNCQSVFKLMSIESVMPSSHLILWHPLLLQPSIFPSIRVFSSESDLRIRWPKYWSFSFSKKPVTNSLQITIIYKGIKQGLGMKNNKDGDCFHRTVQEVLRWRHWRALWEQEEQIV